MPTASSDVSDNELIARVVAKGDQYAFAVLVKHHQSLLRASLRKMTNGNAALADDIAQETFILAWKNIGKFRFEAKFSTWLYRIAFNTWQSDVRRKTEVLLDDEKLSAQASLENNTSAETTSGGVDHIGVKRDIARAMIDLNEAERAAIHQCYYNDLSHDEAAYVLGIPLGTLKTHILRAKEKMRLHLNAYSKIDNTVTGQGVAA